MQQTYADMYALIADSDLARRYFENLPDRLRHEVARRADSIHSLARLKDCAECLAEIRA